MRKVHQVLAFLVALGVMVQAAAIAFAVFGLFTWVDDGGVYDKSSAESDLRFLGLHGFTVHAINGMMVIPLLGLLTLITSFFAKTPGAAKRAGLLFGLIVLQVLLGMFAHGMPILGMFHGFNALAVFGTALHCGMQARRASKIDLTSETAPVAA